MSLTDIRKEIDRVDDLLLDLFIQRMELADQVARTKQEQGLPIRNAVREQEILDKVSERAGLLAPAARTLFSTMMDLSRARQHNLIDEKRELQAAFAQATQRIEFKKALACQGVEGSFSSIAARKFWDATPQYYEQFCDVFEAIKNGTADFGVLPFENSCAGEVDDVYDRLQEYGFYICGVTEVLVSHCLAAKSQIRLSDIQTVYTHPQAINQCAGFLRAHGLSAQPFSNTAAAAEMVAESERTDLAAIASKEAAERLGLTVLEDEIQDSKSNTTRFVLVAARPVIEEEADCISLCFTLRNEPSALYRTLSHFAALEFDLSKIVSRPTKEQNFEYVFYLDFKGCVHDRDTQQLLTALSKELPHFRFLGNYKERK